MIEVGLVPRRLCGFIQLLRLPHEFGEISKLLCSGSNLTEVRH
jgi:hypothetical protein